MVRILDVSWASRCWPMLEILPELMGQLMSVQTCFSRAVFRAILSRCLHTPRHLQGVWDPFPQMESMEQSCPDVCTLPDTSRECGTPSPRQNLRSNLFRTSAHSQTPPKSVGPLPLDRISGAISSGYLHTPRHLQRVWDPFPQTESLEQSCLDVCTLPDTSKECGTPSPGWNLQRNLVWTSAHSQTPPKSVGPLPPDRISRAISSGCLHVMRSGHVFPLSLYSTSFPLHATPLTHIAYGLLTDL